MVTGRPARGRRPRVLVVVDTPGWAHDHKTLALRRALSSRYSMRIRYQHQVGPSDVETADLVMVYYWQQLKYRPEIAAACANRRAALLVGICSHVELEGTDRDAGLEVLNRLAGRVFVNSRHLEREFGPLVGAPVHYTPNGVDTTRFRPDDPRRVGVSGTLRVGWSGSRSNWPDDHRGIRDVVLPALEGVPGLDLVMAAREDRWRSHDEMVEFYRGLDVYVCASVSEGTPNPCLEAAACSVPLVTTPVGNMPEFVRDGVNGILIERSAAALRAALIRLRDDPAGRRSMGAAARATSEAWDWRHQAEPYASMFDAALDQGRVEGLPPSIGVSMDALDRRLSDAGAALDADRVCRTREIVRRVGRWFDRIPQSPALQLRYYRFVSLLERLGDASARDRWIALAERLEGMAHDDSASLAGGAWYHAGRLLWHDEPPRARAAFERCLALVPHHAAARRAVSSETSGHRLAVASEDP